MKERCSPAVAAMFGLMVLTATRSSETRCAEWDEFDLAEKTWTIPPGRTKSEKSHTVPLSDQAMALLAERRQATLRESPGSPYVFTGRTGKPYNHNVLRKATRIAKTDGTPHGVRELVSGQRDWPRCPGTGLGARDRQPHRSGLRPKRPDSGTPSGAAGLGGPRIAARSNRGDAMTPEAQPSAGNAANRLAPDVQASVRRAGVRDRYRGCLLGLAAGDALGTTLEFRRPGSFEPIDDMIGGGPFGLEPGQWTDDTSMALCLAESLIECRGFDASDQMRRYVRWHKEGHLSSTGTCFDIGNTTFDALMRFRRTGDPLAGSDHPRTAGNGSLMRLAPIPMFFAATPREAVARAAESSGTTHGAIEAVDACRHFAGLLVSALTGAEKDTLLEPDHRPAEGTRETSPLTAKVAAVAGGSFRHREPPQIRGTGYVVETLEAALWAFHNSTSFREGALLAVNLGDDADTTGAIYGQIAGAYYGAEAIPQE